MTSTGTPPSQFLLTKAAPHRTGSHGVNTILVGIDFQADEPRFMFRAGSVWSTLVHHCDFPPTPNGGVAHAELDSTPGNRSEREHTRAYSRHEARLLLVEGTARENADIEGDGDPHVKLQEPRFSHLATPEEAEFLTLPSSPSPPTSRRMLVRSAPVANTAASAIPESDHGADLALLQGTPLPPTPEAARTQHFLAVNAGPLAIRDPEDSIDLVLPPPP